MKSSKSVKVQVGEHFFDAYMDYNKALRNWLVGFGIGGPLLMLSDNGKKILECEEKNIIFSTFVAGVFLQIFVAFINKNTNWWHYDQEANLKVRVLSKKPIGSWSKAISWISSEWSCALEWLAEQMWIDILADIVSMTLFLTATILAGKALLK
jgi:hypothetical protein